MESSFYKMSDLKEAKKEELINIILDIQYNLKMENLEKKELELELKYLKKEVEGKI